MPKRIDITGQRFGRFVAIHRSANKDGQSAWLCRCDCGREKEVLTSNLRRGATRSCGCLQSQSSSERQTKVLEGAKFGMLTVVSRAQNTDAGKAQWNCLCDCGREKVATSRLLLSNQTKSCGCLPSRRKENHHAWKGGRTVLKSGYVVLNVGTIENRDATIFEHRQVMEQILGRQLKPEERVHHKNGIRDDNRPENLELWVNAHPTGQRVIDLVEFSLNVLREYAPELLKRQE